MLRWALIFFIVAIALHLVTTVIVILQIILDIDFLFTGRAFGYFLLRVGILLHFFFLAFLKRWIILQFFLNPAFQLGRRHLQQLDELYLLRGQLLL